MNLFNACACPTKVEAPWMDRRIFMNTLTCPLSISFYCFVQVFTPQTWGRPLGPSRLPKVIRHAFSAPDTSCNMAVPATGRSVVSFHTVSSSYTPKLPSASWEDCHLCPDRPGDGDCRPASCRGSQWPSRSCPGSLTLDALLTGGDADGHGPRAGPGCSGFSPPTTLCFLIQSLENY